MRCFNYFQVVWILIYPLLVKGIFSDNLVSSFMYTCNMDQLNWQIYCDTPAANVVTLDRALLVVNHGDFQRPSTLYQTLSNYLCDTVNCCRIEAFVELIRVLEVYATHYNFPHFQIRHYRTLYRFIVHNLQHSLLHAPDMTTKADILQNQLQFHEDISISIILAGDICYDSHHCAWFIDDPTMESFLTNLRTDIEDLASLTQIQVIYGYSFPDTAHFTFQAQCALLQSFFASLPAVMVGCYGKVLPSELENPTRKSHFDLREELSKYAYDQYDSDYYLWLDMTVSFQPPMMLLSLLQPLLLTTNGYILQEGLTMGFGSCTGMHKEDTFLSLQEQEEGVIYPIIPILTKKHMEIFADVHAQGGWITNPHFPVSMNNYFLFDLYRTIDGIRCVDEVHSTTNINNNIVQKVFKENSLLSAFSERLEDYWDMLQYARRILIDALVSAKEQNQRQQQDQHEYTRFTSQISSDSPAFSIKSFLEASPNGVVEGENTLTSWLSNRIQDPMLVEKDIFSVLYESMTAGCVPLVERTITSPPLVEEHLLPTSPSDGIAMHLQQMLLGSKYADVQTYVHQTEENIQKKRLFPIAKDWKRYYPPWYSSSLHPKVAVISVNFGHYEKTCKAYVPQTIPVDFICFMDEISSANERTVSETSGWIIDTIPYHVLHALREEFDMNTLHELNAYHNNQHPFNNAKFYKMQFHQIPRLQEYDVIIWIDGSIRIINPNMIEEVVHLMQIDAKEAKEMEMMIFRQGNSLQHEVWLSESLDRYIDPLFGGYYQPIQQIRRQYEDYLLRKHVKNSTMRYDDHSNPTNGIHSNDTFIKSSPDMYCSCFMAFNMRQIRANRVQEVSLKRKEITSLEDFLNAWYAEKRRYATKDQISLAYLLEEWQLQSSPSSSIPPISSTTTVKKDDESSMKALEQFQFTEKKRKQWSTLRNVVGDFEHNSFYMKLIHGL